MKPCFCSALVLKSGAGNRARTDLGLEQTDAQGAHRDGDGTNTNKVRPKGKDEVIDLESQVPSCVGGPDTGKALPTMAAMVTIASDARNHGAQMLKLDAAMSEHETKVA